MSDLNEDLKNANATITALQDNLQNLAKEKLDVDVALSEAKQKILQLESIVMNQQEFEKSETVKTIAQMAATVLSTGTETTVDEAVGTAMAIHGKVAERLQ